MRVTDCKKEYVDLQWQHGNQFSMHHHIHTFWLEMFASYVVSVFASILMIIFWSIFLFCCWIKDLWLCKCLSSCVKWDIKGIIKPKNQVFMQNTNFISFWSTRALLDLFFKKPQFIFCWKSEKLDPKNCDFFDWHSFCLYKQYIYKKIVVLTQLHRRYYMVTKRVAVKSSDKNKTVSL